MVLFLFRSRSSSFSSRFHLRPRVRVGSGCTEAIYFWHPFLLRLVHPFIICICFCRPVPVGPVFVGPLGAHVSIFLVPARRHHRQTAAIRRRGSIHRRDHPAISREMCNSYIDLYIIVSASCRHLEIIAELSICFSLIKSILLFNPPTGKNEMYRQFLSGKRTSNALHSGLQF